MTAIDYAPPTPWFRRRKFRRIVIWSVVAIAIGIMAWNWGPGVYRKMRVLYWQRECMNFSEPPGTVVDDVAHVPAGYAGSWAPGRTCAVNESFRESMIGVESWVCWTIENPLFLHRLRNAAGERLVGVEREFHMGSENIYGWVLYCEVLEPAKLTRSPRRLGVSVEELTDERGNAFQVPIGERAVIYVGQVDPTDEAAFVVPFDMGKNRYVAKLRLKANGEEVELVSVVKK